MAKNPPDGAIVDYYLPAAAKSVTLEISDSTGKLVRRYSSGQKQEQPHPPMAIAERWLPKPVVLENAAGAHRFVWDLRWGSSGGNPEIEEEEGFGAPRGPRAAPGNYQLKLTVDGKALTQPLKVEMDPRSQATRAELEEQLRLGLEFFAEVRSSRKALAEIAAVKKRLSEIETGSLKQHPELARAGDGAELDHREDRERRTNESGSDQRAGVGKLGSGSCVARGGKQRSHGAVAGGRALSRSGRGCEGPASPPGRN